MEIFVETLLFVSLELKHITTVYLRRRWLVRLWNYIAMYELLSPNRARGRKNRRNATQTPRPCLIQSSSGKYEVTKILCPRDWVK